jgi:hypothetical protein
MSTRQSTPETDAELARNPNFDTDDKGRVYQYVDVEFARRLENERDDLRASLPHANEEIKARAAKLFDPTERGSGRVRVVQHNGKFLVLDSMGDSIADCDRDENAADLIAALLNRQLLSTKPGWRAQDAAKVLAERDSLRILYAGACGERDGYKTRAERAEGIIAEAKQLIACWRNRSALNGAAVAKHREEGREAAATIGTSWKLAYGICADALSAILNDERPVRGNLVVSRIKVECASDQGVWYASRIGETFDVVRFEQLRDRSQGLPESVYWVRTGDAFNTINYVRVSDAGPAEDKR